MMMHYKGKMESMIIWVHFVGSSSLGKEDEVRLGLANMFTTSTLIQTDPGFV